MNADPQPTLPDPRTDDDATDAEGQGGRSATAPAEGADDAPGGGAGSPDA